MKRNHIFGIGLVVLLFSLSLCPLAMGSVGRHNIFEQEKKDILPLMIVIGFFPQVHDGSITYFGLPQFRFITIPQDSFEGYLGFFFIYGVSKPDL